jgi:hypothetical protein
VKLSYEEAAKLIEIGRNLTQALSALEGIRPGGGFKEYIDETKECKRCGAPISKTSESVTTVQTPDWFK